MKWAALGLAIVQLGAAQTSTSCNPTEETCDANTGLDEWEYSANFVSNSDALARWTTSGGTVNTTDIGAKFTIAEEGEAPTLTSDFYIFFGHVDVTMRASNGTGIISTYFLESDDLDEIDWEQISTYSTEIQTDYFGKGNTTSYDRDTNVDVTTPEETFHTYSIDWTEKRIEWLLDGDVVRTLEYADAVDGTNYPQTPSKIKIGIWSGGDVEQDNEGTIEWAGGETDFDDVPFIMWVESIKVINYNPAKSYTYSDKTGDFSSIVQSNSTTSNTTSSTTSTASFSTSTTSSGTSSHKSSSEYSSSASSKASSSSVSTSSSSVSASAISSGSLTASTSTTNSAPVTLYSSFFMASMVAFAAAISQF
ncbi:hypothetical protein N7495_005259 [Penicillium taxi]|uniref:uncharacterized protein n=1 Tax=Penicillium taxi TaxID=168475 RepID=UPI0025459713|nr:uncharacterized protein N7495_005259 [Penicillium taxi]KAJ5893568.1 hypothetical protein N7495_005259 [Penicillium taxi]